MPASASQKKRQIRQYAHPDKTRPNNPAVGLVTRKTDPHAGHKSDLEAARKISELAPEKTDVQMNTNMQTDDLKKKRGDHANKWQVKVNGLDYLNTRTGKPEFSGKTGIAVWLLDTNYDGRSLYPTQVFFPMVDAKSGWTKLAKNLRAEIDEGLIESYRGTVSLPFPTGGQERVAVKIVDDRGIEMLRVINLMEVKRK